jgi:hypothetical protein
VVETGPTVTPPTTTVNDMVPVSLVIKVRHVLAHNVSELLASLPPIVTITLAEVAACVKIVVERSVEPPKDMLTPWPVDSVLQCFDLRLRRAAVFGKQGDHHPASILAAFRPALYSDQVSSTGSRS